jgi:D-glycero-D-manno-heptose 1,7-bisphosphate phosphatase
VSSLLVVLDRDGVLNAMPARASEGGPDSPLHVDEVALLPGAARAVAELRGAGAVVCIASNQPAAAKGKVSLEQLQAVHRHVLDLLEREGGRIDRSYLCFHRREDGCECRKPKPALLLQAAAEHPECDLRWMAGDRATDVQAAAAAAAAAAAGFRSALLGGDPEQARLLEVAGLRPDWTGPGLAGLVRFLLGDPHATGRAG